MNKRVCQGLIGVACLVVFPHASAVSEGLRDEAVRYRAQGLTRQGEGDWAGALTAYRKAAALDPSYAAPHNDLGVVYEQLGRIDDARRAYERALAVDAQYLKAHTNLGLLFEQLGDQDQAVSHWIQRYRAGEPNNRWTNYAGQRLLALKVLTQYPGLKGLLFTRHHVIDQAFQAQARSLREFESVTERYDWR